jgi:hypothetical protein
VQVDPPVFTLTALCPVCEQGEALALLACKACGHVEAECVEDGSVFRDPRRLTEASSRPDDAPEQCLRCGAEDGYRPATGDEIQAAGIPVEAHR